MMDSFKDIGMMLLMMTVIFALAAVVMVKVCGIGGKYADQFFVLATTVLLVAAEVFFILDAYWSPSDESINLALCGALASFLGVVNTWQTLRRKPS